MSDEENPISLSEEDFKDHDSTLKVNGVGRYVALLIVGAMLVDLVGMRNILNVMVAIKFML